MSTYVVLQERLDVLKQGPWSRDNDELALHKALVMALEESAYDLNEKLSIEVAADRVIEIANAALKLYCEAMPYIVPESTYGPLRLGLCIHLAPTIPA